MIRFAVIGTNWISHAFCLAAHLTGRMQLVAVYSRQLDTAQAFAREYGVERCFTTLEAMVEQKDIDAVYISSPNSLHAPQATLCMRHGKHVLVEKPMASNLQEVDALIAEARKNNVVLFEAMKSWYTPNLAIIREALPQLGTIHRANFGYCQYSSRIRCLTCRNHGYSQNLLTEWAYRLERRHRPDDELR